MSDRENPPSKNWLNEIDSHRGQIDRLGTLSDGVFAVGMTVLVLEVRLPENWDGTIAGLGHDFRVSLTAYAITFLILVAMWSQMRRMLALIDGIDGVETSLVMAYLALIGLVPFAVRMQIGFTNQGTSILIYVGLIAALTAISTVLWIFASFVSRHVRAGVPPRYRYGFAATRIVALIGGACGVAALFSPDGKLVEDDVSMPWLTAAALCLLSTVFLSNWMRSAPKT